MSKILIVDDSSELLEVLQYFLEENGFEVLTVAKKEHIVDSIRAFSPDLILLDIYLHGADGREICREMRKHKETKYLCILMFSASPRALVNYKEYGADGYLEKPFGLTEMVETIYETLETCKDYHPSRVG